MTQHESFSPGEILKTSFKVSKTADDLNDKNDAQIRRENAVLAGPSRHRICDK